MELTVQQNRVFEQIKAFMKGDSSVFILRGYAGTGKTTMVKVIVDYLKENHLVSLMAPTGRAARVLATKTGYQAATIHKSIYDKACVVAEHGEEIADAKFKFVQNQNRAFFAFWARAVCCTTGQGVRSPRLQRVSAQACRP